jgi:Calcineurin-like phosphoesterase
VIVSTSGSTLRQSAGHSAQLGEIALPQSCLLLAFGDRARVAEFAMRHLGGGLSITLQEVAREIGARRSPIVDATGLARADLQAFVRVAGDHFAATFGLSIDGDREAVARALGAVSVTETFTIETATPVQITRVASRTDRRGDVGSFDIIGDIHGCADELEELLQQLGYRPGGSTNRGYVAPTGRRAIFLGDLVDRGPASPRVLEIVMAMVADGHALAVVGNHDWAFLRWLEGRDPPLKHGLAQTVAQMAERPTAFHVRVRDFIAGLTGHLWLDAGRLAVAHAGVREAMLGRSTGKVHAFTLYGDSEGKPGADGLPVRYHWALEYSGEPAIVYGHTPVAEMGWANNTLCIDTGCCFGGALSALRWPERETVQVAARAVYVTRGRAFGHPPPRPKRD